MSIVWPPNAALLLIRLRRDYQAQFELAANRDHAAIWSNISLRIILALNFIVTGRQCQIKWQALKSGYENASRIMNGNTDGHEIRSPNRYDRVFYQEMSDEFWLSTDRLRHAYRRIRSRERRRRSRNRSRSRNRRRSRHRRSRSRSGGNDRRRRRREGSESPDRRRRHYRSSSSSSSSSSTGSSRSRSRRDRRDRRNRRRERHD